MKEIIYLDGDATLPMVSGFKIIAHICNDVGVWGAGFALSLSRRWIYPEESYRQWYKRKDKTDFFLGNIRLIQVEPTIYVANMLAKHDTKFYNKALPIRYRDLESCLGKLAAHAETLEATVHMPRIGCGLAGGTWDRIEPLILSQLCEKDIQVYVYNWK